MKWIVGSCLFAIVIIVLMVILTRKKAEDLRWSLWINFASTFMSVILGLGVWSITFNHQEREKTESDTKRYREVLKAELTDLYYTLKAVGPMTIQLGETNLTVHVVDVQATALEDAARSGLFSAVDTHNLLHVASMVKNQANKNQYLYALLANLTNTTSPLAPERLRHVVSNIEDGRALVLDAINTTRKHLNIEWSPVLPPQMRPD